MQLFSLHSSQARGARGKEEILYINSCKSIELLAPSCKHQRLSGPKRNHSYFSFNRPNCGVLWSKSLHCCSLRFFQVLWEGREQSVSDICFVREAWCWKPACRGRWACHSLNSPQIIAALEFGFVHPLLQIPILRWSQRPTQNWFSSCCDAAGEFYFDRLLKAHFRAQNSLFCKGSSERTYSHVSWGCSILILQWDTFHQCP